MGGRIPEADIAAIKQRANIVDVIGDYVTLKRAGVDSLKGLCPFHEERTPSFNVSPNLGRYHCFGCQESGDVISFLTNYEHLSFTEAVERLAERVNYTINYEENSAKPQGPSKTRLYAAHKAAAEFYEQQLATPAGAQAVQFMAQRGFDRAALAQFAVGFSPDSWTGLTEHLRGLGFSAQELLAGGLVLQGNRGVYDRFRGRIMWPIRDATGQVVGFGARRFLDSDQGPKYLNSPESPIYHKAQVLYGIDLAKRTIAKDKRAIIVEGYTDVMACHLAGVPHAVATCGTAFGVEHIAVLRRILGDDHTAEVIFTFDPDSAGQAAALKAYGEEARFSAGTYVANNQYGYDPSDLRQHYGDSAVVQMFTQKTPLFEFALRQAVAGYDLNSVAGRYAALKAAVPILARIRDKSLQPAYVRELAGMLGIEVLEVNGALTQLQRNRQLSSGSVQGAQNQYSQRSGVQTGAQKIPAITLTQLPRTNDMRLERDALMAILQRPQDIGAELLAQATTAWVSLEPLVRVRDAIGQALKEHNTNSAWVETVVACADSSVKTLVRELAVAPLPQHRPEQLSNYCRQIVAALLMRDLGLVKKELMRRMQRIGDAGSTESKEIQKHMAAVEFARRQLQAMSE